jgi:hypothetical protein
MILTQIGEPVESKSKLWENKMVTTTTTFESDLTHKTGKKVLLQKVVSVVTPSGKTGESWWVQLEGACTWIGSFSTSGNAYTFYKPGVYDNARSTNQIGLT